MSEQQKTEKVRRSPRHVKAAAKILQKEARKILRKHGARIAAEPAMAIRSSVEAIDGLLQTESHDALEDEAEKLDELLHQHASFARKSALRETLENITVAVLIALGLRSCFYEPFKIPSGSMMPTLLAGDHIFVNKFVYGIQIPFTTTVIGESIGEIERGDVIVFRYPLDESEDFIKRVIGLPGDELKVVGRTVAIRREGETTFEVLEREPLDEPCYDDSGTRTVAGCQLYSERLGDKTYVVRYMTVTEEREDIVPRSRVWKVPEGHLLVMGDNRNQSHDSLAWTVKVEAVSADKLLTPKDLRDLTPEKVFKLSRPEDLEDLADPRHDRVAYTSDHRSRLHDLSLAVWRAPSLGAKVVFDTIAANIDRGNEQTIAGLLEGKKTPARVDRGRVLEIGERIDALVVGRTKQGFRAVVYLADADAVLELGCGKKACRNTGLLAARIADTVERFHRDHEQDARALLEPVPRVRYSSHWSGRSDIRDHFVEIRYAAPGAEAPQKTVRLRAFRQPQMGVELIRDAALRALGSSVTDARALGEIGEDAWLVEGPDSFGYVGTDHVRDMVVMLECGKRRCADADAAIALVQTIQSRVPEAASDRRKLDDLLVAADVPGWRAVPVDRRERNDYDQIRLEATVQGKEHSVEIEAWLKPSGGVDARLQELSAELGLRPDDSVVSGGYAGEDENGYTFLFGVPESESVVRIRCNVGLCSERQEAVALARRAAAKASDASNFIDPEAEQPSPFVPRGHVKGRAERIWLPLSRFWLPIR